MHGQTEYKHSKLPRFSQVEGSLNSLQALHDLRILHRDLKCRAPKACGGMLFSELRQPRHHSLHWFKGKSKGNRLFLHVFTIIYRSFL